MITLTYKNHINETVSFNTNGLFMTDTELHDYKWSYVSEGNKISYFTRGIVDKKFKVAIVNPNRVKAVNIANQLMECTEKDLLAQSVGKLFFNDYYIKCFVTASVKSDYNESKGYLVVELTVTSDEPVWIKEISKSFNKSNSGKTGGKNLDFPYGQPFDFASGSGVTSLINTGFADADFKMIIYGESTDPTIFINDHEYTLTGCTIESGQYVIIDSKSKTITLVKVDGSTENYFRYRNKDSYIFEKIPSGENPVSWTGDFVFDVTLYEERSEPKWT